MVRSERGGGARVLQAGALLFLTVVAAYKPAGAAGSALFIGQFPVEDARATPSSTHTLHYRIDHNDPELLASRLARWNTAAVKSSNGVTFSLDNYPVTRVPDVDDSHLDSSFVIDFREPPIQALKDRIASRYGLYPTPDELEQFVFDYIEDKNVAHGFDVASVVAQSRAGDCTEHAVLLTAILRMYGYPARTVMGLFVSLQEPVMGYGHAWTEYHGEAGWTGIDGTRIDDSVGAHYIPLGIINDESIAYRLAIIGVLHSLSINGITVE